MTCNLDLLHANALQRRDVITAPLLRADVHNVPQRVLLCGASVLVARVRWLMHRWQQKSDYRSSKTMDWPRAG